MAPVNPSAIKAHKKYKGKKIEVYFTTLPKDIDQNIRSDYP